MRILALHGWRTNKDILAFQLGGLSKAFKETSDKDAEGSDAIEIVCINAPKDASGPPYPEVSNAFGDDQPYYEWWDAEKHADGTRVMHGMEDSAGFVIDYIMQNGPFDALLGFSQGGAMVSYLQARVENDPSIIPTHLRWRCCIFIAGVPVFDTERREQYFLSPEATKERGKWCPTIHMIGEKDQYKELCGMLHKQYHECAPDSTSLIEFPEPHHPPTWRRSSGQLLRAAKLIRRTLFQTKLWWAFDFDGVLCHSAKETCLSGLRAGHVLLPDLFTDEVMAENSDIVDAFVNHSRPLLEHGYHSIILSYMFLSRAQKLGRDAMPEILKDVNSCIRLSGFGPVIEELEDLGVTEDDLKQEMRNARDQWIEEDLEGWLSANEYYEIAVRAVSKLIAAGESVYVITTKHQDYAIQLLNRAGLELPEDHVFGAGMGAKETVIESIAANEKGKICFFIEDRVGTLERVAPKLDCPCRLAFAQWGYNTDEDLTEAKKNKFEILTDQVDLADVVRGQL